ncbi:hypothetical protein ACLKA7_001142 [Drosophila subpalustris]
MVLQVNSSRTAGSKEKDTLCGTYCYQVVKPLLQFADSVKSNTKQFTELQDKIKEQAAIISSLNDRIELNKITAYQQTSSCFGKLTELHTIEVPNTKTQTFTVPCDSSLAGSGWTVIQRRMDGSVNFNRTWSEYKEGFGNLRGEFFIGLEKLHLLTQSQPHELYISVTDFANETRYARYSNFVIGSEENSYELEILGLYSGNAGDSMGFHKHMKFSTPDRDHGNFHTNCAEFFGSGWWFTKCYNCNLNGHYVYEDTDTDVHSIEWRDWKKRPMKFAQMMIKPKSY